MKCCYMCAWWRESVRVCVLSNNGDTRYTFTTVKCVAVVWIGHFGVCQRDSFLLVDGNGV